MLLYAILLLSYLVTALMATTNTIKAKTSKPVMILPFHFTKNEK